MMVCSIDSWWDLFREFVELLDQQWIDGWRLEHAHDRPFIELGLVDVGGEG